jgi:hypothetical protein
MASAPPVLYSGRRSEADVGLLLRRAGRLSSSGVLIAAAATAAGAALTAGAVWWYRGLPHVQGKRRWKQRERMIERFRKHLPRGPEEGPPAAPRE